MILRRLNNNGIEKTSAFLDSIVAGTSPEDRQSILVDQDTSEELPFEIHFPEACGFARRFEVAEHLFDKLKLMRTPRYQHLETDTGIWSWLALLWFDELCPDSNGRRRPGERARWILTFGGAGARYYRHLLYGPYVTYKNNASRPTNALALLCDSLNKRGRIYDSLTSRSHFITCPAVLGVATRLYYDTNQDRLRRGAVMLDGPGSVYRLIDVLHQLDLTYDLHSTDENALLGLLPQEFNDFGNTRSRNR